MQLIITETNPANPVNPLNHGLNHGLIPCSNPGNPDNPLNPWLKRTPPGCIQGGGYQES